MQIASGDLGRLFSTRQMQNDITTRLNETSNELVTGRLSDPAAQHGVAWLSAAGEIADQYRLRALLAVNSDSDRQLNGLVESLGSISKDAADISTRIASFDLLNSEQDREVLRGAIEAATSSILSTLNRTQSGRFLFSGVETTTPPIKQAEEFWQLVDAEASTASNPIDGIRQFFQVGGGFDAEVLGLTAQSAAVFQIEDGVSLQLPVHAGSETIRNTLSGLALARAALAGGDPSSAQGEAMANAATQTIFAAQTDMLLDIAMLGTWQERAHSAARQMENSLEQSNQSLATLVAADPYETATRLEALQTQLETLFAVSARSGRISLLNFLR